MILISELRNYGGLYSVGLL